MGDPQGSIWRRWDPHLHAPGTTLNDQFGSGSLDEYLDALETATPQLSALGITDYSSTRGYETVIAEKANGRLPDIPLVFPNVELRLSIGTKGQKAVNLHLLVSPEDPNHLKEIGRFLGRLTFAYGKEKYCCKREDLIALGRAHDSSLTDDEAAYEAGVNQFKVDFNELKREVVESDWVQHNVLFAVAGSSNDGTAGMQDDTSSFAAQRVEIEAFCHIVFASGEKQVAFWLGNGTLDKATIEERYRGLKPCMHGSDAHSLDGVARPANDRYTWLKGDATFDALRQACIEPAERVHIGSTMPVVDPSERSCVRVQSQGAPWLVDSGLPINPGLVAIIGARGSGKTALADLIARGAGSPVPLHNESSFVRRAAGLLRDVRSSVVWSSGRTEDHHAVQPDEAEDSVHYLSQQFVDRLCSADGPNDELIHEIEKVVFASHPAAGRLGATTFNELLVARTGMTHSRRDFLRDRLDRLADEVLVQRELRAQLSQKQSKRAELDKLHTADIESRKKVVRKGEQERADHYERLKTAIDARNRRVQSLEARAAQLNGLSTEAGTHETEIFPEMLSKLKSRYHTHVREPDTWSALEIRFQGEWREAIGRERHAVTADLKEAREGSNNAAPTAKMTPDELGVLPLTLLDTALEAVGKEIGLDKDNARKLNTLNTRIASTKQQLDKLDKEIEACREADATLSQLFEERTQVYRTFFETVVEEETALRTLYEPLERLLEDASETVRRLRLVVVRRVDVDSWATRGEELLDLRKTGKFKGRGAVAGFARESLQCAWESGSAEEVSEAMAAFRKEYDDAFRTQAPVDRSKTEEYRAWTLDIGRWLYSTDHIQVAYSFEFDGVGLSQLSPGTRGVVLLLLYLALDLDDDRPLIIDQPEENLDPRTIYTDLVALFGEARKRRQVIMVTHNANLVVNTDVDQVIVATSERVTSDDAPHFTYRSGGLEDPDIRADVCEILEGGKVAFLERAKRLRVGASPSSPAGS